MICALLFFFARCTAPLGLMPEHERILKQTGWLDYVQKNAQAVQYVPAIAFVDHDTGETHFAAGYASVHEGKRTIFVAANNSPLYDALTLVHEAAHLEGMRRSGLPHSQERAVEMERRMMIDYLRHFPLAAEDLPLLNYYWGPKK